MPIPIWEFGPEKGDQKSLMLFSVKFTLIILKLQQDMNSLMVYGSSAPIVSLPQIAPEMCAWGCHRKFLFEINMLPIIALVSKTLPTYSSRD
ncbi:unnamed protein product [Allacma fusca]|uniref:Uncharacterized protein n=1 Tax=Allacma fusca TaxID=39272 RepID=A0A8J2PL05_9HEXA|nr:unnamed protein product [Allacma fusca]